MMFVDIYIYLSPRPNDMYIFCTKTLACCACCHDVVLDPAYDPFTCDQMRHAAIDTKTTNHSKDCLMFLKEVSYAHQGCIYLIKNTVKTAIL